MNATTYTITHELIGDSAPATAVQIAQIIREWNTADWTYHTHEHSDKIEVRAVRNEGSDTVGAPDRHVQWHETSSDDEFYIVVGEVEASITTAFEAFMADEKAVEEAIDNSTSASYGGGSYKLELFHDGTYRVLASNRIGNAYKSDGIIISIPTLREDEMAVLDDDDNEVVGAMYDNAIEELRRNFDYAISEA